MAKNKCTIHMCLPLDWRNSLVKAEASAPRAPAKMAKIIMNFPCF